ncbi:MAG TPA: OmpA family protein, partial [Saprospiraceae bacterium]|nr:OmpA family protein [Saprospiraceae bacterium]
EDDGIFLVCIPAGEAYALNVSKPGYTFYSANFTMDTVTRTEPFDMTISLQKITGNNVPGNKPVVLNNIFFNTGSASLRQESEYELNKLLAMLVENPSIKIQINGHTDDVGNEADNLKLSTDRAKAVYDFLKAKGIDAARLSYKGFGEKMPLVENKDEKSRQTNRRTEFEIK